MPGLCCRCLPRCCVSGKKRKSFPIHEKHHDIEVNKIFIRNVESIRVKSSTINRQYEKNTKSKASTKKNNSSRSPSPLSTLFTKSKQLDTPSPLPMAISDVSEENLSQKKNISQIQNLPVEMKPSAKSKLVLENVRKMIKDQNVQQEQYSDHTRQKESIRL